MKRKVAHWLAKIRGAPTERAELASAEGDDLVPSDEVIQTAGIGPCDATEYTTFGDYMFQEYVITNAKLQPDERILDAGCGVGQIARPISKYLSANGSYEGFDINAESIKWCQDHYRDRFPNFRFQVADIYNSMYNPNGTYKASEFAFPYSDSEFDVVLLSSVFTHMLPNEVDNYFSQIRRVLKPCGRCVITYFLINRDALRAIAQGICTPKFPYEYGSDGCRLDNRDCPEAATGHDEEFIRRLYDKYGLSIEKIEYGEWCRRSLSPLHQDTITATKYVSPPTTA